MEDMQKALSLMLNMSAPKPRELSPSVSERLKKLEEMGVIRGYRTELDADIVGLGVTAFIFITAESSDDFHGIVERACAHPEILECHAVTGDGSHLVKARTHSTTSLEDLLSEIQRWPGVGHTRTNVVLSSPKETTTLPLAFLKERLS